MNGYLNTGRQIELDIARGITIIFMVLIHTIEYFYNGEDSLFFKICNFFGSFPGAPVFMFVLGCGIVYSKHAKPGLLLKRGIIFFLLSYIFNALVYVAPYLINSIINDNPEFFEENWTQIYDADILQFAGLSFIFFAFMKMLNFKNFGYLMVGIFMAILATYLNSAFAEFESKFLQAITGLFWGTHEGSYFPFLSWIAYPISGYLFADVLIKIDPANKGALYKKLGIICGVIYLIMLLILIQFHELDDIMDGRVFYHQSIFFNIMFASFVVMWIGVLYGISFYLPKPVVSYLKTLSVFITPFYVIHYIFIIYVAVLFFDDDANWEMPPTLLMVVVFTILTYITTLIYAKFRKRKEIK